jgi:hypothetical protein
MTPRNASLLCIILAVAAAFLFALGAIEAPSHSLKDSNFDLLLGLMLLAIAFATTWIPVVRGNGP